MNLQVLIPLALKISVLLSVFAIGLRADARDAFYLFRRPAELARALLAMNVVMPLLAIGLVIIFHVNPAVKIALVALSVSPIPPLLPRRMVKAGGTTSYVGGLLVAVSLLAIIFVPLAMQLIGRFSHEPLQMTASSVAKLVIIAALLPIALGLMVRRLAPAVAGKIAKPIAVAAGLVLLLCVAAILYVAAPAVWSLVGNATIAVLGVFVVVGLVVGYLLGGPERENRTALAIATSSRHPGIAIAIAQTNFPEQKLAMAGVLLYLVVNGVASVVFNKWIDRRNRAT
jgi:bile acid:Na+ symporter, BASS family